MAYIATDGRRARFGLQFDQSKPIDTAMQRAIDAIKCMPSVDLLSSAHDFGLDRQIRFVGNDEALQIQAEQLPRKLIVEFAGDREVLIQLYDHGSDEYAATLGDERDLAWALGRYMTYNFLSLDWIGDGNACRTPAGCMVTLYRNARSPSGIGGGVDSGMLWIQQLSPIDLSPRLSRSGDLMRRRVEPATRWC
jgi:hypothetical protein